MHFLSPYFLFLLLPVPLLVFFYIRTRKSYSYSVKYPRVSMSKTLKSKYYVKDIPFTLMVLAFIFAVAALARPVNIKYRADTIGEGIYISLVVDVSPSMMAEDIRPTRLEASKNTIAKFIEKRQFDKISLVTFAMRASVIVPATFDYTLLEDAVESLKIDEDGSTSIGLGIATAVDMLRNVKGNNEKVIILLTDGENNAGEIEPNLASEIASNYNIKIYTIGLGEPGQNYAWVTHYDSTYGKRRIKMPFQLNEKALIDIANTTGGKYFNAKNASALDNIYNTISRIEKKTIIDDSSIDYIELFRPFAIISLLLLILSVLLKTTRFLTVP